MLGFGAALTIVVWALLPARDGGGRVAADAQPPTISSFHDERLVQLPTFHHLIFQPAERPSLSASPPASLLLLFYLENFIQ